MNAARSCGVGGTGEQQTGVDRMPDMPVETACSQVGMLIGQRQWGKASPQRTGGDSGEREAGEVDTDSHRRGHGPVGTAGHGHEQGQEHELPCNKQACGRAVVRSAQVVIGLTAVSGVVTLCSSRYGTPGTTSDTGPSRHRPARRPPRAPMTPTSRSRSPAT